MVEIVEEIAPVKDRKSDPNWKKKSPVVKKTGKFAEMMREKKEKLRDST